MASKWTLIKGVVRGEVADLKNDFMGTNGNEKSQMSPKQAAKYKVEMDRREKALKAYQRERNKRREKEEHKREKFRDAIREKYGIERPSTPNSNPNSNQSQQVPPSSNNQNNNKSIQDLKRDKNKLNAGSDHNIDQLGFKEKLDLNLVNEKNGLHQCDEITRRRIEAKLERKRSKLDARNEIQNSCRQQ